jgi:uncharacterized protein YbcI
MEARVSGAAIDLPFGVGTRELEQIGPFGTNLGYKIARMEETLGAEHSARLEISNGIVQLMSNHYGRGPTKAKTFVFERYVLIVLEDLLTRAESTMVENGRGHMVREMRLAFQADMADEFKGVVERALGRRVMTYQSQVVFDPPMGFEIFVLDEE